MIGQLFSWTVLLYYQGVAYGYSYRAIWGFGDVNKKCYGKDAKTFAERTPTSVDYVFPCRRYSIAPHVEAVLTIDTKMLHNLCSRSQILLNPRLTFTFSFVSTVKPHMLQAWQLIFDTSLKQNSKTKFPDSGGFNWPAHGSEYTPWG